MIKSAFTMGLMTSHMKGTARAGRWLVTWLRLEMPADLPEELRRELLIVE
jgi:hypothetical protein